MGVKLFADFFFREGGAEGKTIDMFSVIFRHFPSCVRLTSAAASSCFLRVDSKIIRRWMDLEGKKKQKSFSCLPEQNPASGWGRLREISICCEK